MKTKILIILSIAAIAICMITPLVYWFMNPELSQMQMFLKFWWVILVGMVCFGLIHFIIDKKLSK